ncbi:MAG: FAD-binding oxidoreductase [Actinobacteria bacterium]|nr:FAD-binding oxidoreductase [Actinomycetota bacterium]
MAKSSDKKKIYADVAVIGGGVIGSSAAYYLSRKNFDVVLLEKKGIACGASGACDGFISLQSKKDRDIISLTLKSIDIFKNLPGELSYDIEYKECGGLVIYSSNYSTKDIDLLELNKAYECYYKKKCNRLNRKSYKKYCGNKNIGSFSAETASEEEKFIEILGNKKLKSIEPFISDEVSFGTFCRQEGQVNPLALSFAFALAAKKNGAKIYTEEEVKSFQLADNAKINRIFTQSGKQVTADEVLLCAGAWTPELGKLIGACIPIKPRRGNLAVTEILPETINHPIIDYDYICCKFDLGRESGFTIEQTKSGNLLIGSTREFTGFESGFDFNKISGLLNRAVKIFPVLSNACIIRIFEGFRPYSCDSKPFIGMIPGFTNLWIASGHEGDGIALSPVTGKLISELISSKVNKLNDFTCDLSKYLKSKKSDKKRQCRRISAEVKNERDISELFYSKLHEKLKGYEGIDIRKFSPEKRIYSLI